MSGNSKVNFVGCWLLTFMLVSGKLAGLTDLAWWQVVSPALAVNALTLGMMILRGILTEDED